MWKPELACSYGFHCSADLKVFPCPSGSYHVMDAVASGQSSHTHHEVLVDKDLLPQYGAASIFVVEAAYISAAASIAAWVTSSEKVLGWTGSQSTTNVIAAPYCGRRSLLTIARQMVSVGRLAYGAATTFVVDCDPVRTEISSRTSPTPQKMPRRR